MKILKIPVWWSAQEAEGVLLFLEELRMVISHTYGEEIQKMHRTLLQEQNAHAQNSDGDDEIPF